MFGFLELKTNNEFRSDEIMWKCSGLPVKGSSF